MGCSSSKDAVQEITVENGVVKPASGKSRKIKVQETSKTMKGVNQNSAEHVEKTATTKTTSAKSRDSGIDEMDQLDDLPEGMITEESHPNGITDVEGKNQPSTPNLSLVGQQLSKPSAGRERMKSQAILEELESQGLITGSKVHKGGAAFDVGATGSASVLEPLPPLRPPPRLERLERQEKPALTKEELELKQMQAEFRRQKSMHKPKRRSRLASQLAKDQEMASHMHNDAAAGGDANPEDGTAYKFDEEIADPFKSRKEIPHD